MADSQESMIVSAERLILYQMFIAFGQGACGMQVGRPTCRKIHERFLFFLQYPHCLERIYDDKTDPWGQPQHGPQVLERVRAVGRLAALYAVQAGLPEITETHFSQALDKVVGMCPPETCEWCMPPPKPAAG
jgi:hypothetical protein